MCLWNIIPPIPLRVSNSGFEAYIGGGCVRNLLLKRVPKLGYRPMGPNKYKLSSLIMSMKILSALLVSK
jgi:hypothetical protein